MIPWKLLDRAPVPGGEGGSRLYQRGEEFSIRVTGHGELMNSRAHGSEDALAALACARLVGREQPRLLIGGLGMGFTLAVALRELGPDAEVVGGRTGPRRGGLESRGTRRAGRQSPAGRACQRAGDRRRPPLALAAQCVRCHLAGCR